MRCFPASLAFAVSLLFSFLLLGSEQVTVAGLPASQSQTQYKTLVLYDNSNEIN